ncbi:HlyD family efflux transporter periplasmic adaptor subunit [Paenibacillus sp. LHD-117]|uniref:HlyD family efflux transporter periplasmic adaptor subunit n=1 Tax=Paenibacillus sp. LHD-117 TaxID=3071412 RepID=UPI0027E153E9|nr:HlyD family efflux transporter periplasmic adaptor subunit [Paenibacillus sp. LHD-117]MDQ6422292.1 HlyD family efflux transporter periplasmic adaptor subunit [Paenibacillus sp. LHD-117]
MRAIIRDMADLSDSREMMEARTHPIITIFMTIVVILLAAALSWAFIGEIDEVAKASAVARPNEKVSGIQTSALGTVEKIHVREGQAVKTGDSLISLEHQELQAELDNRQAELVRLEKEQSYFERYLDSVRQHHNLFDESVSEEQLYYTWMEQYLLEYSRQQLEFESSRRQVEQTLGETMLAHDSIQLNKRSSKQKAVQSEEEYRRKITELEGELGSERLLKQSMESGDNSIGSSDPIRTERFQQYTLRVEQLTQAISDSRSQYEQSAALGERFVAKSKLEEQAAQVEALEMQLKQYIQEAVMGVQNNLDTYGDELRETKRQLELLLKEDAPVLLEQESLRLEEAKILEQRSNLEQQNMLLTQSSTDALEKFKLDRLVQIQATMEEKERSRHGLQERIDQLQIAINKQEIVAPIDGNVHVLKEIYAGAIVQAGEPLLSIIPADESMYKMSIAVPNHEVGHIAVGDKVDLNFHAFPKQSFGSLAGTVTSISTDATVQQDGRSYYMVEASIANKPLVNRKGEHGEVRIGMTAEAYIVTDSKKIIYYILEKINLRE